MHISYLHLLPILLALPLPIYSLPTNSNPNALSVRDPLPKGGGGKGGGGKGGGGGGKGGGGGGGGKVKDGASSWQKQQAYDQSVKNLNNDDSSDKAVFSNAAVRKGITSLAGGLRGKKKGGRSAIPEPEAIKAPPTSSYYHSHGLDKAPQANKHTIEASTKPVRKREAQPEPEAIIQPLGHEGTHYYAPIDLNNPLGNKPSFRPSAKSNGKREAQPEPEAEPGSGPTQYEMYLAKQAADKATKSLEKEKANPKSPPRPLGLKGGKKSSRSAIPQPEAEPGTGPTYSELQFIEKQRNKDQPPAQSSGKGSSLPLSNLKKGKKGSRSAIPEPEPGMNPSYEEFEAMEKERKKNQKAMENTPARKPLAPPFLGIGRGRRVPRSADPEPIMTNNGGSGDFYSSSSFRDSVKGPRRRSANPEAEPEAEPVVNGGSAEHAGVPSYVWNTGNRGGKGGYFNPKSAPS